MEKLLLYALGIGVDIRYEDLHRENPLYDGYAWPSQKVIGLDRSIRYTRQERCVLAEELGHCVRPPWADQKIYHSRAFWEMDHAARGMLWARAVKDERAALRWGVDFVIPDWIFWEYVRTGPHELWEWCEYFDVEKWFMEAKIGYICVREHELGRRVPKTREFIRRA